MTLVPGAGPSLSSKPPASGGPSVSVIWRRLPVFEEERDLRAPALGDRRRRDHPLRRLRELRHVERLREEADARRHLGKRAGLGATSFTFTVPLALARLRRGLTSTTSPRRRLSGNASSTTSHGAWAWPGRGGPPHVDLHEERREVGELHELGVQRHDVADRRGLGDGGAVDGDGLSCFPRFTTSELISACAAEASASAAEASASEGGPAPPAPSRAREIVGGRRRDRAEATSLSRAPTAARSPPRSPSRP